MLILGLLGMYFDAAVVCICHQADTFIKIGCGHIVIRSNLRRHITNTHVKPKQCQYCEKRFGVSENLEYHIENHHPSTSDQKYFCSKCGKGFMYQTTLTRHMSEKHVTNGQKNEEKSEYKCPACKKMYSTKGSECSIQIYLTFSQIPPCTSIFQTFSTI